MHQRPDVQDLLAAAALFLRDQAIPQLPGHAAYHARVAANMVDIVRRQLQLAPAAEVQELQRLRVLLQHDGSLAELNTLLCARIADGSLGLHTPGLALHLWQPTLDKLAVDQPGYASYRRARAAQPDMRET